MKNNIACRIFAEQIKMLLALPNQEEAKHILYQSVVDSLNQFEKQNNNQIDFQNDNQTENQNENAYYLNHISVYSLYILNNLNIKWGDLNKGKNHWNWRGGKSSKNKKDRCSVKYKKWRDDVLKRDEYKCFFCGSKNNLHVHHIHKFSKFENERTDIDNGLTLCCKCHHNLHKKEGY